MFKFEDFTEFKTGSSRVALIPDALKIQSRFPWLQTPEKLEQGRRDSRRPEKSRAGFFAEELTLVFLLAEFLELKSGPSENSSNSAIARP